MLATGWMVDSDDSGHAALNAIQVDILTNLDYHDYCC